MNDTFTDISPISVVSLFDTNKEGRETFAQSCIFQVTEGYRNPLEVHVQLKNMEDIIKRITGDAAYKKAVLEEAEKNGKQFEMHNAKVQVKEAGTKWLYDQCNDSTLQELQAQAEKLNEQIKERQKLLQNIPEGGMADPETGNLIYRAAKQSETTVAITLK